jgi:hypothetical protein
VKREILKQIAMKSKGSSRNFESFYSNILENLDKSINFLTWICPTKVEKEHAEHIKRSIIAMRLKK